MSLFVSSLQIVSYFVQKSLHFRIREATVSVAWMFICAEQTDIWEAPKRGLVCCRGSLISQPDSKRTHRVFSLSFNLTLSHRSFPTLQARWSILINWTDLRSCRPKVCGLHHLLKSKNKKCVFIKCRPSTLIWPDDLQLEYQFMLLDFYFVKSTRWNKKNR